MAGNSLGRLMVFLGLDGAEFTRGLTKAEYQAQQFSRNVNQTILKVGKVLGGLEIGRQFLESTKAIIDQAASLNDLADITGSSVEQLSRLTNQAAIAGTDFATLQSAVVKLSAGMAGTDEESTKAKEALKALGITTRDPVEALQQVAVKLNGYADGVNKVGLAVALFGKQGGQFLATLKDIAELQDVQATITAKQAEEAENLQKAFARLGVEATGFKNAILSEVVPALTNMIEEFRVGTQVAGGFWGALKAGGTLNPFDTTAIAISKARAELEALNKASVGGGFIKEANGELVDANDQFKKLNAQLAILDARQKRETRGLFGDQFLDARDLRARGAASKPEAPPLPKDKGKTTAERISDAERLLESLRKQEQATQDLSQAQLADIAITELRRKADSGLTDAIESQIRAFAAALDADKERKRVAEEFAKSEKEIARAKEDYLEATRRSIESAQREVESITQGSDAIREQIIFLQGGQAALDAYDAAKREAIALEKEHMADMLAAVGAGDELVQKYREMAAGLRAQSDLVGQLRFAENLKKEAEAVANLKGQIFDVVGGSIEDLILNGGKASDVLKALERDLIRFITSQAMAGLKDFATGGNGGGIGNLFAFIGSLFGGGGGVGAGVGIGSGGIVGFASGGVSSGGMAIVGERGPELVNLPAGTRVHNAGDTQRMLAGGARNVTVNIDTRGQPITERTARNLAREMAAALQAQGGRG